MIYDHRLVFAPRLPAPELIQAQIGDNAINPRIERALEAEITDVAVGFQESFLVDILGVVLAAGQVQRQAKHLLLILLDQGVECHARPGLRFADKLGLRCSGLDALLSAVWSVHCCSRSHASGGLYLPRGWPS